MEIQQWVTLALWSYRLFCRPVDNIILCNSWKVPHVFVWF